MVDIVEIQDLADPRLDIFARLTEAQLRHRLEAEQGVFIAESAKVIDRALDAGLEPIAFLMEVKRVSGLGELLERAESALPSSESSLPVFVAPGSVLQNITGYEVNRGALAAFHRPEARTPESVLAKTRRVAVLEDITNAVNIGAIFRSAAALGMNAVLLSPGCCDPLNRRAVRVSMGTVFQVPWAYIGDDVEGKAIHGNVANKGGWSTSGVPLLREQGFKTVALALREDALSIDDPSLQGTDRLALLLGTEGVGLSATTIEACDAAVKIPMHHGVDSLNVAAASAVAFWELRVR